MNDIRLRRPVSGAYALSLPLAAAVGAACPTRDHDAWVAATLPTLRYRTEEIAVMAGLAGLDNRTAEG